MTDKKRYRAKRGRVYFVDRGISRAGCCGGRITYATYCRKASGSLKRVVSKYFPTRASMRLADFDLADFCPDDCPHLVPRTDYYPAGTDYWCDRHCHWLGFLPRKLPDCQAVPRDDGSDPIGVSDT